MSTGRSNTERQRLRAFGIVRDSPYPAPDRKALTPLNAGSMSSVDTGSVANELDS